MFSFFQKKQFLTRDEEKRVMKSIKHAETESSGEVRVYIESRCHKLTNERTVEIFRKLKMQNTHERNGVLIYIALDEKKFAIFGDEGIHHKLGFSFWTAEAATLKSFLTEGRMVEGICQVVEDIGQTLKTHFPHPPDDKNELPDKPVYGK